MKLVSEFLQNNTQGMWMNISIGFYDAHTHESLHQGRELNLFLQQVLLWKELKVLFSLYQPHRPLPKYVGSPSVQHFPAIESFIVISSFF